MNKNIVEFFKSIIAKNIESETIFDEEELIELYKISKNNLPLIMYEYNNVHIELYILYHFVLNLNACCGNKNKRINFLIPNIYNFLISRLPSAKFFLSRNIKLVTEEFVAEHKKLMNSYFVFYDRHFLKSDILDIFFLGMFLNTDPINIENYTDYYHSIFRLIFFAYLKSKTEGLIGHELPTTLSEDDMHVSNRCKLFEDGIKLSQIYCLCNESETLKRIHNNFNEIRSRILPNDFQKLYSLIIDKNNTRDNKFLILKFNIDSDDKITKIKTELPLIYKLLRSIKVRSKNKKTFTYYDRTVIKKMIRDIVYSRIELMIGTEYAEIISESISKNLECSITNGEFLDPYTLTVLQIDNQVFMRQLKIFLGEILENIQIKELEYVG